MYSPAILSANLSRITDAERARRNDAKFSIIRFSAAEIDEMVEHLDKLIDKQSIKEDGQFEWKRELTLVEQRFIDNELILCQIDFKHWAENYAVIELASSSDKPEGWDLLEDTSLHPKSGPLGKFILNGMQLSLMDKLAALEERCYDQQARGVPVNGILLIILKARQLGACLTSGTKVLTDDLRWVPIESVRVGQSLLSVDENAIGRGAQRKLRTAVVEATKSMLAPAFKIILSDGRELNATSNHRFLSKMRGGSSAMWRTVGSMVPGDLIRSIVRPWGEPNYEDGWFAGFLDGEGSLRPKHHGGTEITGSQVFGEVLMRAMCYLIGSNYNFRDEVDNRKSATSSKLGDQPVHKLVINRLSQILQIVGKTRPSRFLAKQSSWWEGKALPHGESTADSWATVVSIEPIGECLVHDLQTSTKTFIAEGLVSHNSTLWQALLRHRVNFYSNYPVLVASIDAQSTQALQRRSDRIYTHLPLWMRAKIKRQTVDGGVEFTNGSLIELQDFKQQKDLGKGETWRGFHGTELSVIPEDRFSNHFDEGLYPAIPFDRRVLFGEESTAKGKTGAWYDLCTNVMSGTAEGGAGRFDWFFAPFYLIDAFEAARGQRSKYRMEPPANWEPSRDTVLAAERVWDTSAFYMPDHSRVRLTREVMYWYELTRQQYFRKGRLNIFKQSYPIEPIDAFQHSAAGAFTNETIDRLQQGCAAYEPFAYRLMTESELPEVEQYADMSRTPIHHAGAYHLGPMHQAELDDAHKDPRGIVWIWEQPDTRFMYVQSSDPSGGIPRWSRQARTHNDLNTDNAAAQVWRKHPAEGPCEKCKSLGWLPTEHKGVQLECSTCDGRGRIGGRGVQVAEYAAPLDPEDLALILFVLGRIYRGSDDLDECQLIVNRIGVGMLTIRTLQNKFNCLNLWQTEAVQDGLTIKTLAQIGFNEHPSTVPILHSRGRLLIVRRDMEPRSKFLVKEFGDAVVKTVGTQTENSSTLRTYERFYVPPGGGRHDDRMVAAFLAGWVLFPVRDGDDLSELPIEGLMRELPAGMEHLYNKELAGQAASAADQSRIWNEVVGQIYEGQDLNFAGHFDDCADNCQAEHGPSDGELALDRTNPYALGDEGGDDDLLF